LAKENGVAYSSRASMPERKKLYIIINKVLYPPTTLDIFETLKSDPENRFTTLIKALKATKLDREIKDYSSECFTYFNEMKRTYRMANSSSVVVRFFMISS
jgi:hypothetical protein